MTFTEAGGVTITLADIAGIVDSVAALQVKFIPPPPHFFSSEAGVNTIGNVEAWEPGSM